MAAGLASWKVWAIGTAIVLFILLLTVVMVEGFDVIDDARARAAAYGYTMSDQQDECLSRTSCSSCLTTKGPTGIVADCGWCPNAEGTGRGKCLPKVNAPTTSGATVIPSYPVIPRDEQNRAMYVCPVTDFVSTKDGCTDVQCSAFTNCAECAQNTRCGWCKTSGKCLPRSGPGATGPQTSSSAAVLDTCTNDDYVTSTAKCPVKSCDDITSCLECAATTNCGYCVSTAKCLKVTRDQNVAETPRDADITPSVGGTITLSVNNPFTAFKVNQEVTIVRLDDPSNSFTGKVTSYTGSASSGVASVGIGSIQNIRGTFGNKKYKVYLSNAEILERCGDEDPLTTPTRCPGQLPTRTFVASATGPRGGEASTYKPSAGSLATIQSNEWSGDITMDAQTNAVTNILASGATSPGAVPSSPPRASRTIGTPGTSRPVNADAGSARFAAADVDGTLGPFERYISMLVRSSLAAAGIPSNEPFQAEPILQNADSYLKQQKETVFRGKKNEALLRD